MTHSYGFGLVSVFSLSSFKAAVSSETTLMEPCSLLIHLQSSYCDKPNGLLPSVDLRIYPNPKMIQTSVLLKRPFHPWHYSIFLLTPLIWQLTDLSCIHTYHCSCFSTSFRFIITVVPFPFSQPTVQVDANLMFPSQACQTRIKSRHQPSLMQCDSTAKRKGITAPGR